MPCSRPAPAAWSASARPADAARCAWSRVRPETGPILPRGPLHSSVVHLAPPHVINSFVHRLCTPHVVEYSKCAGTVSVEPVAFRAAAAAGGFVVHSLGAALGGRSVNGGVARGARAWPPGAGLTSGQRGAERQQTLPPWP